MAKELHPQQKAIMEEIGQEIIDKLGDKWFEVDGTPKVIVKYPDGQFKQKPLIAGWNFKLEYAYVGQKGKLNFGLTPEDAQEYTYAECEPRQLDTVFPMVGPAVAEIYGLSAERLHVIIEELVATRLTEMAERKEQEQKIAETNYQENEAYGLF